MKKLVKFAVVIMMIIIVASCNKKEVEPVKFDDTKVEKTWAEKQEESFLYNSKTLTSNVEVFFEELFKSVDSSVLEGQGSYYLIKAGNNVSYYRDNNDYSGTLKNDIIAMNVNGDIWVNGGKIKNLGELSFDSIEFELHLFPKTLDTGVAMKFANKYEGTYWPIADEKLPETLESLHYSVNDKDEYGYRIDLTRIYGGSFAIEFVGYEVLMFDEYGKRKPTREEAMKARGEVYNEDVVENFVLSPRDSNQK